ncbi:pyruvate formate lyase activating enzyme [Nitratiruptor sp. YY08-26]|uniref:anaerobic ribonucleoside-triphosphate reductase activating protein n=1 Tax=unclassified Nitratiruptor TaxID=2624044 RepID=UPI0019153C42|nr:MULTISPECIES: anaerobic ribonucleoside-triphosphate reductase activating protein [unclassified Nitratiruptor]BCD63053.1 pyruvate formate lyase activating enzyme [Nitratiruptor sp. YY08-13]BCD66988.1 pyruvate formate lyase activating enzyme [Nitratiruptor sp. YY08-26]
MQGNGIKIYDLTSFTLLDFPDTPAAILWLAGCNMRCPYCHNPDIVYGKNEKDFSAIVQFLKKRRGLLEGVVISGGEPTIHKDIETICATIKDLGYKIKLDTNGSLPQVLEQLLAKDLLDFIAIDFKAPKSKFLAITKSKSYENLIESLHILNRYRIPYQVRTTVHTDLLDERDIEEIIALLEKIGYTKTYYIQNFINLGKTLLPLPEQKRKLSQNFKASFPIAYRNF